MATDLIQRAAAICGYPFTPNSDQLAAWLATRATCVQVRYDPHVPAPRWMVEMPGRRWGWFCATLLDALAAAVVEVDRIEREAAK